MIIFSFSFYKGKPLKTLCETTLSEKKPQIQIYKAPVLIGMFIEMLPSSCKCPHISHIISCEAVLDPKEDAGESLNQNERRRIWRIESLWIVRTEHSIEWNKRESFKAVDIGGNITPKEDIISCPHPCFGRVKLNAVEQYLEQDGSQFS